MTFHYYACEFFFCCILSCYDLVKKKTNPRKTHFKTPNLFLAAKGASQFWEIFNFLLLPVWGVDVSVYRMLLTGAAAACECDTMCVTTLPYTPSDLQPPSLSLHRVLCPAQTAAPRFWLTFLSFAQHSLLRIQTKWIKKTLKDLGFSLEGGNKELFQGNTKLGERDILLLGFFLDAFSRLRQRLLWFLCFVISL